jgi:hypothetical protein
MAMRQWLDSLNWSLNRLAVTYLPQQEGKKHPLMSNIFII